MDGHIWTSPRGINPVIWSSRLYPASSRRESTTGQLTLAPPTSQWIISNSMLKVLRHSEKRSRTESHLPSRTPICSRNISMWPQSHNRDTHLTHSSLSITHTQLLKLCRSSQYRCMSARYFDSIAADQTVTNIWIWSSASETFLDTWLTSIVSSIHPRASASQTHRFALQQMHSRTIIINSNEELIKLAFAKCQDLIHTIECSVHFIHGYPAFNQRCKQVNRWEHCTDRGHAPHDIILKISALHAHL